MYDPMGDDDHTPVEERAQVVRYLRKLASRRVYGEQTIGTYALQQALDAIEAGKHYTDSEPQMSPLQRGAK